VALGGHHLRTRLNIDSAAFESPEQSRNRPSRIDAGLPGDVSPAANRGRQTRLQPSALPPGQPLRIETELAVELVPASQLLGLVTIQRHVQGTLLREPGVQVRLVPDLPGERGPAAQRLEVEREEPFLAPGRLADRGEHPGGDAGGTGGRAVALQDAHPRPPLSGPPGAGEADHAGADEDRVISVVAVASHGRLLGGRCAPTSLRRHYPDQVQTVGGASAALSALGGLPLHLHRTHAMR
jgi:hypothetical protein